MASPLSEFRVTSIYDTGHLAFPVEMPKPSESLAPTDLSKMLEQPNCQELIQALSPLTVYRALVAADPEVRLEVADKLTSEQVTGIFDFDIWKEDRISPRSAFQWLKIFGEVGTEELYTRFKQLDEDYQLAILGPFVRVYDQEEYERMSDAQQDRLTALPASEFYYEISTADPDIFEGIENLIESTMAHDMAYTISLLAHACFLPPAEQELLAAQFRKARIEEEGFVSFEESLSSFSSINLDEKFRQWHPQMEMASQDLVAFMPNLNKDGFLAKVLAFGRKNKWTLQEIEGLNSGFMFVANNLCAASQIETDDERGLAMIIHQVKSLSGLALEVLSAGDLDRAATILLREHPKTLFRTGMTLINQVRDRLLKTFEEAGLPEARTIANLLTQGKFGRALESVEINWLDSLGLQNLEVLKAFFNRYPLRPSIQKAGAEVDVRMNFAPVDSVAALIDLEQCLDACFGLLDLMKSAAPLAKNRSLDQSTTTAIVNALTAETFSCEPISRQRLEKFCQMSSDELAKMTDKFLTSLKAKLNEDDHWSVQSATKKYIHCNSVGSIDALIADLGRRIQSTVDLRPNLQSLNDRELSTLMIIEQL
jgi:hypothetical protein